VKDHPALDKWAANERRMNLSDKLWSAYATYATTRCYSKANQQYTLDPMAEELLAQAVNYETHGTF